MKLLIYSDLQATDGSESCYHNASLRLQDWRVRKFFEILRKIYDEYSCDGLVDLGDTTDDRSSIPVPTIDALLDGLRCYDGWNIKLIGNHEQYTRDARIHVGRLFEHKFTVVDTVSTLECPGNNDTLIVCASYPGDYSALVQQLEDITTENKNRKLILFGHFQVIGCQLNSGLAYDGIPKELLKRFTAGFLGHVHKPQIVSENVQYVGSPFQQNFGEAGEYKRVAVFDTVSLETEWVSLADCGFPVYRTVTAPEFVEMVSEESEDRFHVVLGSTKDTEIFYGHALCNRAETEYSYTTANEAQDSAPQSWSFEAVLDRWMAKNPPKNSGIELSDYEMRDIGAQIARGNS